MASRVIMPKLTDSMVEGVVVKWRKAEGDRVESGDVLAEIETDKAVMDLEAFGSGTLRKILVSEGSTVPSGALIGIIAEPDEDIESLSKGTPAPAQKAAAETEALGKEAVPREKEPGASGQGSVPREQEPVQAGSGGEGEMADPGLTDSGRAAAPGKGSVPREKEPVQREKEPVSAGSGREGAMTSSGQASEMPASVSPRVRTLAREQGIDLTGVKGSGPGGRIIERDIKPLEAKRETKDSTPKSGVQHVPLSQMRKAVVRMTTQSKAPVPHFYVMIEADMTDGLRIVDESKSAQSPVSINHLIIASCARALRQHPAVNAAFGGDAIKVFTSIDIGIAVSVEDGLIVPVLRDCGSKTLAQIAEAERVLVSRTRNRQLQPEEYSNPTFLISNLGMYEVVENFIALILPPAAAALAVGSIREVPVARHGRVEIRSCVKMTLSCDHRVIDGVGAAKFLQALKSELEHPEQL
ncbi:MAG TPA: dihydrolipoamide acetyltransferase family protein [Nitrospirales bacterium]|jgi:pyruvate dehydrogenase E2 component (dihydrolipoamide acetyltransferase)